jgi:hypothetical protein
MSYDERVSVVPSGGERNPEVKIPLFCKLDLTRVGPKEAPLKKNKKKSVKHFKSSFKSNKNKNNFEY